MLVYMKPHTTLPYNESSAYTLGITTSQNVIDQKRNVIHLEHGFHTVISVTPQFVETTDEFEALEFWSRKCRLPHETHGMNLVKNYSRHHCLQLNFLAGDCFRDLTIFLLTSVFC